MKTESNRRQFIKLGGVSAAGLLAFSSPFTKALAASCGLTPPQTPGPFYPGEALFHHDNDLTQIQGHPAAQGQVVYVKGKVLDGRCKPIADATVEIWQACVSGRYNNPKDTNPAALDPHFKYWGETSTNAQGEYIFKTIIPGAYPADSDWTRPPHIHFKVTRLGYHELVTQLYFKGDPLNEMDLILKAIPAGERDSVIVDFSQSPAGFDPKSLTGNFNITLRSIR